MTYGYSQSQMLTSFNRIVAQVLRPAKKAVRIGIIQGFVSRHAPAR
jgi:hypothetical protein